MAAVTRCNDFEAQENKVWHCFYCFLIYFPWSDGGSHAKILIFWMLSFKEGFSLHSFTFFKRLFHSSLLSAISMVSSTYLRLLMFFPRNLYSIFCFIQASLLHDITTYKLNKQDDNTKPWYTPFPIWNQSIVPCLLLTDASWPAYRFHRRQIRWSGSLIPLRIFHSLLWSIQRI